VCSLSPPAMVAMLVMMEELQEQLLAWEVEMNGMEGAIVAWEDGLTPPSAPLGGHACSAMTRAPRPRRSDRITSLAHVPLPPVPSCNTPAV
jgi:hypothetical protein